MQRNQCLMTRKAKKLICSHRNHVKKPICGHRSQHKSVIENCVRTQLVNHQDVSRQTQTQRGRRYSTAGQINQEGTSIKATSP